MDTPDTRRIIFEFAYQTKYSTKYLIETHTKSKIVRMLGLKFSMIDSLILEQILYKSAEKREKLYKNVKEQNYRKRLL